MTDKLKNIIIVCLCGIMLISMPAVRLLSPQKEFSQSERRQLASFPEINTSSLLSGRFMENFENYSMDQFPMREAFRRIKALSSRYVFMQSDKDGIYLENGHLSKLEYPENQQSVDYAASRFNAIYNKYLCDNNCKVYLSVIPDKNFYMNGGRPTIDFNAFTENLCSKTSFMKYIDISDCLDASDYYKTDSHWRQEKIIDVAQRLAGNMGTVISENYDKKMLDKPFYGVYYGQAALPFKAEKLYYLDCDAFSSYDIFDYEANGNISMYDMKLAHGRDSYEMFLSGSKSLISIKNPNADNNKKLILFRDSFGSSIAPLLSTGYSEVILVDIRYISSEILGSMIDFDNCDVLFLYSLPVLNNSITLK